MKLTVSSWIKIAGLVLFGLWLGVPTFNKWKADKLVDELCAKDGGVKVYETVTLPKERFNQWGQFQVLDKRFLKPNDEYYAVWEITNIQGRHESSDIAALSVYQYHVRIFRKIDNKNLGEGIAYARRGGDAIGPWMPSSHSCSDYIDNELTKKIFFIFQDKSAD